MRVVLLAALAFGLAALLLALFLGAVALALGARAGVRAAALAGGLTAAAAAVAWAGRALLRTAWTQEAAARTVARDEPGLRSDLVSSVELAREREDIRASGRYSVALVDEHLARTAARAGAVDLSRAIPDRLARAGGLALVGVAVLHGVALLAAGGAFARAYGRILAGDPRAAAAAAMDPITGDVALTYTYPAYMRREPRTLSGTGGEIRAPKGTEVALETRADRDVAVAEVAVSLEAAPAPSPPAPGAAAAPAPPAAKRYALAVKNGRDLAGRLVVEEGGSYRFRFLDGRGRLVAEGPPLPVTVEPDAFPEARITRPDRELEVEAGAVVRIEWQAEDDFGLGEVALVLTGPDGEERRRLLGKPEAARRDGGVFDLDLGPERLGEGDRLAYWVEAQDGDAVSGPKKARLRDARREGLLRGRAPPRGAREGAARVRGGGDAPRRPARDARRGRRRDGRPPGGGAAARRARPPPARAHARGGPRAARRQRGAARGGRRAPERGRPAAHRRAAPRRRAQRGGAGLPHPLHARPQRRRRDGGARRGARPRPRERRALPRAAPRQAARRGPRPAREGPRRAAARARRPPGEVQGRAERGREEGAGRPDRPDEGARAGAASPAWPSCRRGSTTST